MAFRPVGTAKLINSLRGAGTFLALIVATTLQQRGTKSKTRLAETGLQLRRTQRIAVRVQADNERTARKAMRATQPPVPTSSVRAKRPRHEAIRKKDFDGCSGGRVNFVEGTSYPLRWN